VIDVGRELCGDLATAESREWLVTNGIGGYACGTVAGVPTRRYHGLLIASQRPPVARRMLVSKFDEIANYDDGVHELGTTRWRDGTVAPQGYRFIERFRLDGSVPVWTFAFSDALLEKRVWMEHGENTTYVTYTMLRGARGLELRVKVLVDCREHHALGRALPERTFIERIDDGIRTHPADGSPAFVVRSDATIVRDTHEWYLGALFTQERARGLDDVGDLLHAGNFTAQLRRGASCTFVLSTRDDGALESPAAFERREAADAELLRLWSLQQPHAAPHAPPWIRRLVLAADQFVVRHARAGGTAVPSILAGYPWFADWGRDAMVSLPGLLLRTGRAEVARDVLKSFAGFIDGGMLPNYFPEDGSPPEFNTVDGALLFIDALHRYVRVTDDRALLAELFGAVDAIVSAYRDGTRFGIRVDRSDGLVHAGADGVAVTWMDARVGDFVVTPRVGKPVEINALWYHALTSVVEFAGLVGEDAAPYGVLADRAKLGFQRYWNASEGCCFDVLDSAHGNDASLRPNQIFAASLDHRALPAEQQRSVFEACARDLLTSAGLRTLARDAPGYCGHYGGAPAQRDAAYHQGTVWPWLIGPFVAAALNVGVDRETAMSYLEPAARSIGGYGLGTLPEVADGDAPFAPNGCIAQAWSVASALDAWAALGR
jgi:predicted glycogen debranching enzyme